MWLRLSGCKISIHAPRVGSDVVVDAFRSHRHHFNPRPPRGERRLQLIVLLLSLLFQSTPPAWGATWQPRVQTFRPGFQSTPPAWGATLTVIFLAHTQTISIHAPRVGSDGGKAAWSSRYLTFQSTPPAWGATRQAVAHDYAAGIFQSTPPAWGATSVIDFVMLLLNLISIHAPRVGSDWRWSHGFGGKDISIHAPRVGSDEGK